jgi:hypothetical protein
MVVVVVVEGVGRRWAALGGGRGGTWYWRFEVGVFSLERKVGLDSTLSKMNLCVPFNNVSQTNLMLTCCCQQTLILVCCRGM